MTRSGFEYSISEPDRISEAENTTHWKVGALLQPSQSKIYLDSKLETNQLYYIEVKYLMEVELNFYKMVHFLSKNFPVVSN